MEMDKTEFESRQGAPSTIWRPVTFDRRWSKSPSPLSDEGARAILGEPWWFSVVLGSHHLTPAVGDLEKEHRAG